MKLDVKKEDSIDDFAIDIEAKSNFNMQGFNNLSISVIVMRGKKNDVLKPIYFNESYSTLTGLTKEDIFDFVKSNKCYGVHPDDIDRFKTTFYSALNNDKKGDIVVRALNKKNEYIIVEMRFNIVLLNDDYFDVYFVINDVTWAVEQKKIIDERYLSLLKDESALDNTRLAVNHVNVTKNAFRSIFTRIHTLNKVEETTNYDNFLVLSSDNLLLGKERDEFINRLNRENLVKGHEKGELHFDIKVPVLLLDGRVFWCYQSVSLAKNPKTGDLEAILVLKEANQEIRSEKVFDLLAKYDYEYVGVINTKTELIVPISETNPHGLVSKKEGNATYEENLVKRMVTLVDDEFTEDCIKNMRLERIEEELKEKPVYYITYPANKKLLPNGGAFLWKFGYMNDKKEEILITRREVISMLDHSQRVDDQKEDISKSPIVDVRLDRSLVSRNKILVADDSDINREMLKVIFDEDFEVLEANDGEVAIDLIDKNYESLALILLDIHMPKKTGLDVLIHLKVRNLTEFIPVIIVTGTASNDIGLKSLEYGVSDLINKPFDSKIVRRRALNLIELYSHNENIEKQLDLWKEDVLKLQKQSDKNNELLINTLSSVVEARSLESGLHIKRVRALTEILLSSWRQLYKDNSLTDDTIKEISLASTLHDIGKVAIPDAVLNKPGRLTFEEFEIMKTHTTLGSKMIENFKDENNNFYKYCFDICKYHHEKYDGKGYPCGLKGEEIPLWSQIVSIVDVYDALISPRVYKAPFTHEEAVKMIKNNECGVFGDQLLKCFDYSIDLIKAKSEQLQAEDKGE